ncbi:hypothetical protein [Aureispira anguillae]|uniref:Uncharacterized protein n=1 Tax=Aureispira anguillae TaxID=2864201 RepID=A0A916DUU5_9BACT|nr:hypothetical protein [Aureispira anguillae]BDS13032.1 hypothetical protein AsAng_0037600 [Aureispira anguillae]
MKNFIKNPYSLARKGISSLIASESMEATLDKKFKHTTFSKRFWLVNLSLMALAFAVQIASLITAGLMLYHYFGNVPMLLRIPLLLVVVLVIEIIKRIALDDVLKSAFQYREFEHFSFVVSVVFVGISIGISYGGASFVADLMLPEPTEIEPILKSDASIKEDYQQQIAAIEQERDTLRATRLYYGKLRHEDQRSIDEHNKSINDLIAQQREELRNLAAANEGLTAEADTATAGLIAAVLKERKTLRQQLEYTVLGFETLLLLCLCFSWWYYDNCRKERLGLEETTAVENEEPTATTAVVTPAVTAAVRGGGVAPVLNQKKIGFIDYQEQPTTEKNGSRTTVEKEVKYTRKCPVCKKGFIHNSWNHTYCTEQCKITAWEERNGKKYTGRTSKKA